MAMGGWIAIKWANDPLVKSREELDHSRNCVHIPGTNSHFFLCVFPPVLFLSCSKIYLNCAAPLLDFYVFIRIDLYISLSKA